MTLKVTRSQKAVFDRFLEETIDMGAIAFYMPDPTTDGWQFLTADGQPFLTSEGAPVLLAAQWLCMLGDEMPQERIEGIRTVISFSIVVLP
ncbi:hypothetical protein [Tropicibacter sp. R16_0]|uniref:hypothetical protein n=1 Tax=Tropicibacter sp. R16_0 TaxID=2821102 RepID=UPI00257016E0|nr:hypothetical protein [Tropicibacter sp. R16_0]